MPDLHWDASYEIVLALMSRYPDVDVENVSVAELLEWVVALPNFTDDAALANDALLEQLLREWYEETNAK